MRELHRAATTLGIPFFLAGAAARDLVLVNLWGLAPGRATVDIDFAFAVSDWNQFERLKEELVGTRCFRDVPYQQQRLVYRSPDEAFELPIDFIPFHGVASATQTIAWPPEGDFVMNVAGFAEALDSALPIEVEPGLVIGVASLPGLALLKIIAWSDRHRENNKDAADVYTLLNHYADAGNTDRIYEREMDLLESLDYDLVLTGAHLLGRDAARISDPRTAQHIHNLLNSETQAELLVSHMTTGSIYDEDASAPMRLFERFRCGYLETSEMDG